MKYQILFRLIIALSVLLLVGCTSESYSVVAGSEKNTPTSFAMKYTKLNGTKSTTFNIKEEAETEVAVEIVTEEGKISLSIEDKDGNSYYQGTDMPTSSFTVKLDKANKYKLTVNAEKHSGSYKISWGK